MDLLELKKQQLVFDISRFQSEKENLIESNRSIEIKRQLLTDSLEYATLQLTNLKSTLSYERGEIRVIKSELERLKNTRNNYNEQIKKLKREYEQKKQTYLNEIESNYHQEIDLQDEINNEKKQTDLLNNKIKDLEFNIKILKSNPFIKNNKEFDFRIWELERMSKYYKSKIIKNDLEIEKIDVSIEKIQKYLDSLT